MQLSSRGVTIKNQNAQKVDVLEYAQKRSIGGRNFIVGAEYRSTKKYSLRNLKMFIARDIFLCQKQNLLPKFDVSYDIEKRDGFYHLEIKILQLVQTNSDHTELVNFSHKTIVNRVEQILWKYNYEKSNDNGRVLERRFFFEVDFLKPLPPSSSNKIAA